MLPFNATYLEIRTRKYKNRSIMFWSVRKPQSTFTECLSVLTTLLAVHSCSRRGVVAAGVFSTRPASILLCCVYSRTFCCCVCPSAEWQKNSVLPLWPAYPFTPHQSIWSPFYFRNIKFLDLWHVFMSFQVNDWLRNRIWFDFLLSKSLRLQNV